MGKANKIRSSKKKRPNPMGSSMSLLDEEINSKLADKDTNVAKTMSGLNSADDLIRAACCAHIVSLFTDNDGDEGCREIYANRLIWVKERHVIVALLPRLCDNRNEVSVHAIGAIGNMAIVGGVEMCEYLVSCQVITPLLSTIQKIALESTRDETMLVILEQSFNLVASLCEASEPAVQKISSSPILTSMLHLLSQSASIPPSLSTSVSSLLSIISDSNAFLSTTLLSIPAAKDLLVSLVPITSEDDPLTQCRLHCAASLHNLLNSSPSLLEILPVILLLISHVLNVKILQEIKGGIEGKDSKLNDQILALEILSNACVRNVDGELDWEDEDIEGEVTGGLMNSDPITIKRLEIIKDSNLLERVMSTIFIIAKIDPSSPSCKLLSSCRERAIACVSNLIQNLDFNGIASSAQDLWSFLTKTYAIIDSEGELYKENNVKSSIMFTAMILLKRCEENKFKLNISNDEANGILFLAINSNDPEIRVHCIGMMTMFSTLGATSIQNIANCLIQSLSDSSLLVVSETLNSIFDIFADNNQEFFISMNILSILKKWMNTFKTKIRMESKSVDKDVVLRSKEALLNLERFMDYKS